MDNINNTIFIFENGEKISFNNCEDFIITNIDYLGNEKEYDQTILKDTIYANFLSFKFKKNEETVNLQQRIKNKKDLTKIKVVFKNKKYINFLLPSKADPFNKIYVNNYQYYYENSDFFTCVLSNLNLKYIDNLFI